MFRQSVCLLFTAWVVSATFPITETPTTMPPTPAPTTQEPTLSPTVSPTLSPTQSPTHAPTRATTVVVQNADADEANSAPSFSLQTLGNAAGAVAGSLLCIGFYVSMCVLHVRDKRRRRAKAELDRFVNTTSETLYTTQTRRSRRASKRHSMHVPADVNVQLHVYGHMEPQYDSVQPPRYDAFQQPLDGDLMPLKRRSKRSSPYNSPRRPAPHYNMPPQRRPARYDAVPQKQTAHTYESPHECLASASDAFIK